MKESTRLIRATLGPRGQGWPLHAGPVFAAPFQAAGDAADAAYTYGRSHNPTWTELEAAIAGLEGCGERGGGVRVFGSGMAAVVAVFAAVLRPGDAVLLAADAYFMARQVLLERFAPIGVTVRAVPQGQMLTAGAMAGVRLVWVETPGNPRLEITDIDEAVRLARAAGALVACDNTTATPLSQKPLALGADFSVCSDSKAMCGHSDLLLGHVACAEDEWLEKIDRERTLTGGVAGPMEAWLLLRSLATLPLRLERASANALAVAARMAETLEVLYPGLPTHPGHAIAASQMKYFGPVLGFTLRDKAAAERFLAASKLITEATSFGGVTTTAERRRRWGHDQVGEGFIRMSVGCEAVEDLLADVDEALKASREPGL